jgi:hypothetical protein
VIVTHLPKFEKALKRLLIYHSNYSAMLLTYLNFQMYDSDYSYCHIQRFLPNIGKWVKEQYVIQYGSEPPKLPHKMSTREGYTFETKVFYYPETWLKQLFKVH